MNEMRISSEMILAGCVFPAGRFELQLPGEGVP